MTSTVTLDGPSRRPPPIETVGFAGNSDIFFAAVSLTRMPMLVTDPNLPDNPIAFANQAFVELTGYSAGELIGRNCRFLQGADTDRGTIERVREAIARRTDIAVEVLNYRRNGQPFWNALFISPVFARDGRLQYFFASQLDVTRRREAERALVQAQRLEGLGSLAGGVAHEFNNLLTVIHGNLEPLIRDSVDRRATVRLNRVRHAAERAALLTHSMISFARRQRLEDQPLDLLAFVREITPDLQQAASDAALCFELPSDPCFVRADPEQLRAAVTNVVRNATEARPRSGRVTIRLQTRQVVEGRAGEVELAVIDDGVGMAPDLAVQAVDPFFTTKESGTGAGLGLSMAYGFVRQSGGRLEIASTLGVGTTVRMMLPAQMPLEQFVARAEPDQVVMVVDDDPGARQLVSRMLEQLGYGVVAVAGPAQALELLDGEGRIDALITDVVMPGMSGHALAARARAIRPRLPTLYVTGFPEQSGADTLTKPLDVPELGRRIRELLDDAGPVATG